MEYIVKLFPVKNQYTSIEMKLAAGELIDYAVLENHIAILEKYAYKTPVWPKGPSCPICGTGMVTYRKFQSTKPGPRQGTWYANYSCSVKDCGFVAWCKPEDDKKIPSDEPFRTDFLKAHGLTSAPAVAAQPQAQPQAQRGASLAQPGQQFNPVNVEQDFLDAEIPF